MNRAYDQGQTMYGTARGGVRLFLEPNGTRKQETTMTERLGLKSWATGAVVLAAVASCSNGSADPADPSTSLTTAASSPPTHTSSVQPTAPSEVASASASETVRRYVATIDEIAQNPTADLKKLDGVATGSELVAERTFLKGQHGRGERQVGNTAITQLKIQSVNLGNADPAAGEVPTVLVDVCWDVSKVDVLDKSGRSIVTSSRPDTGVTRYTVANYQYSTDPSGGWRVASGQDLEQSSCTAS
jgi:hypothetical protein